MTETLVVLAVVLLLGAAGAVWARRASRRLAAGLIPGGRVTHRRASTGLELRGGMVSFPVPPPALADGPVSLHVEARPPVPSPAPAGDRRVDVGPPPGVDDRRRVDVGPGGRHRRPDGELPPGALGMTGIMRKLDAAAVAAEARMQAAVDAETGRIPRVRS